MMSVETQIPLQYKCPITLEVMKDPVTLATGQTYERGSIQRWFRTGKKTCPTTRQELRTPELIPNLTLQNCILRWQNTSAENNTQTKVPTSPRLLNDQHVKRMLDDIRAEIDMVETLRLLRAMAKTTDRNRKMIVDSGALPVLGSILSSYSASNNDNSDVKDGQDNSKSCEEALGVMAALASSEDMKMAVGQVMGVNNLSTLSSILRTGTADAKMSAVFVLECLVMDDDALPQVADVDGLLPGVVGVLREDSDGLPKAMTAGLRALYAICLPRKNRSKVVEAGAVVRLIELLPGARRSVMEGALAILELLGKCSQGRVALCDHALSIPIIVKAIISQSRIVTELAVKVLHSMLLFIGNPMVHCQAMTHDIMRQLLLVIQGESDQSTKHRAQEILKFLQINCDGDLCINTIKYS